MSASMDPAQPAESEPMSTGPDDQPQPDPNAQRDPPSDSQPSHTVEATTGAVGEPGLPPARVPTTSGADEDLETLPAMPQSSRAAPDRPSTQGSRRNVADSTSSATPSHSAATSRTHIPSLTSRAFFSPMSSQRLQAHRGQRPLSQVVPRPQPSSEFEDTRSVTNRNSTGSVVTSRAPNGQTITHDLDSMPPVSRGTEYSEWSNAERTLAYAELMSSAAASKRQESLEPLQQKHDQPMPVPTSNEKEYNNPIGTTPDRSPKTFMSNFKRSSGQAVNGAWSNAPTGGHAKLSSGAASPVTKDLGHKTQPAKASLGKNYEYFLGNTVFALNGRLQNARDKPVVIITGVLFIVPSCLFFGFSAPWLWHHVSPAVPIFYAYIFFICLSSYLHASLSDPGILPRNLHPQPPPPTDPWEADTSSSEWVMIKSSASPNGAFEVPVKYCKTCNIWRPPRCHHCRACDSCIDTQDHHCMWLNNCVGRRNYRYFFGFVASGTALGIYLFTASIGQVAAWASQNKTSFTEAIGHNRVPFAMFIYGVIAFLYPTALWTYHMYLICSGLTTREYLNSKKFLKKDRHRPFRQTPWWKNFVVVLMRPRPPTYMDFKAEYEEGDQRFGQQRRGHPKTPVAPGQQTSGGGGLEMRQLDNGTIGSGSVKPSPFAAFQTPRSRQAIDATPRDDLEAMSRAASIGGSRP